jgi:IS30 family transposase
VVTVVERKTGLVRIGPIQRATQELTLDRTVKLLWAERQRVKTITADNGTEFHNYRELENIAAATSANLTRCITIQS